METMFAARPQAQRSSAVRIFVLYSTLLMMFSDRVFFLVGPVNIYAAYIIVLTNLLLLWMMDLLWLPRGLLVFLGLILTSGIVGLLRGTGSGVGLAKDFIGIAPNAIYACAFLRYVHFDVDWFFDQYARFATWIALLGILIFPFQLHGLGRLTSIMAEPSSFCVVCVPALLYYADRWQRTRTQGWRFLMLLVAVLLTISSVGFMGLLLGLYLFGTRFRFGMLAAPITVLLAFMLMYSASRYFRIRMDDTVRSLATADLDGANLSSYGVVVSAFVTAHAVVEHPVVGGGLGSFVNAHDHYAPMMEGYEVFEVMGMGQLARWDASSLLLRISAEFGLVGLAATFWFLYRFFPRGAGPERRILAQCLLLYVFLKFLRSGVYFNPEEWLFFITYAMNGMRGRFEQRDIVGGLQKPLQPLPIAYYAPELAGPV